MIAMSPCCDELYGSRRTTTASANDSPRRASSAARSSSCLFTATPRNAGRRASRTRFRARVYRIVTTIVLANREQCVHETSPLAAPQLRERCRGVDIDEDRGVIERD